MADDFALRTRGFDSPAGRHLALTPSDTDDLPQRPRAIYCHASGSARLRDEAGTDLVYDLVAGQILPMSPVRVLATGTNATLYGWL